MSTLSREIMKVQIQDIQGIEELVCRIMNFDLENASSKLREVYEKTKDMAYNNFTMNALCESHEIDRIENGIIRLKNGEILKSKLLADMFLRSTELSFLVITLYSYDEVDAKENDMLMSMFLDSWGTAFIECGESWVLKKIAKRLKKQNLYTTHAFNPGQGEIPMEMQIPIFKILKPIDIEVSLNAHYMMHPKKSISGIFGIQTVKDENSISPCDICNRRETCPNAYA